MYVNEMGVEIHTPSEMAWQRGVWRDRARRYITMVMSYAADADQRGWPVYAERLMDLALRIEDTPLNQLYYHMFNEAEAMEEEFECILREWRQARRDSGVSLI